MDINPYSIMILLSGAGSNCAAILAAQAQFKSFKVCAVLSDTVTAGGLEFARAARVPTYPLPGPTQHIRETALLHYIEQLKPDLIVLAGYMRILSSNIIQHLTQNCLNIHPSLLPHYPGLKTHQRVLASNHQQHGCSVHFINESLDAGPLIAQASLSLQRPITATQLAQQVKALEHLLYPKIIHWCATQRIRLKAQTVYFDHQPVPATGLQFTLDTMIKKML
jgi:phosphoribosylglycinamide formyltransferase 1